MHPAVFELLIRFAESSVPIATNLARNHFMATANKKIVENYSKTLTDQQRILEKHDSQQNHGGGSISPFVPNIPHDVGLIPDDNHDDNDHNHNHDSNHDHKHVLEPDNPPFLTVPKTNDLNQLHAEKWNEYWQKIYDLPDDAGAGQSVKVMKEIEQDMKKYPCPECQEHAIINLKEMKKEGDLFARVSGKEEAIIKLCTFKNLINEKNGKELFDCESLL